METIHYNELEGTRQRLFEVLTLLNDDELNKKPDPSTWSIAQVCHHLYLAETSFAKAIRYGLKQADSPTIETRPIHFLTDRTKKFKAPDIVEPSKERLNGKEIINLLNESRNFLFTILDQIDDPAVLTRKTVKHPLFQELPLHQWVELIYLHERRHIEQIKEIKTRLL